MSDLETAELGEFTMCPEGALLRMGDQLLPTRHHYLLLWVQAAHLCQARALNVSIGWFSISFVFSCEWLPELDLARHVHLREDPALQALALGIRVASRGTGKVTLRTASGSQVFSKDGHWHESGGSSQEVVLSVTRFCWDHGEELNLLRRSCAWSTLPITINGADPRLPTWGDRQTRVERYLEGEGLSAPGASLARRPPRVSAERLGGRVDCRAALALRGDSRRAHLTWVRHGVIVAEQRRELEVAGLSAVLCADDLPTDLTGFALLEGPQLSKRIEEVCVEARDMAKQWEEDSA